MRISTALIPGILAGSFFADLVYSKTIYDIHAVDVSGPQGLKPASNGQVLAGGLTRLQPPKPIARKMVEGKKKRANPVGTCPLCFIKSFDRTGQRQRSYGEAIRCSQCSVNEDLSLLSTSQLITKQTMRIHQWIFGRFDGVVGSSRWAE